MIMGWCGESSLTKPLLLSSSGSTRRKKIPVSEIELRNPSSRASDSSTWNNNFEDIDYSNRIPNNSFSMTFQRLRLLLWKNFLFRKRQYIVTSLEIVLPTLFALLLAYIRTQSPEGVTVNQDANTTFPIVPEETLTHHVGHQFSSHTIAYSPKTKLTASIMSKVAAAVEGNVAFKGFNTEDEIEIFIAQSALGVNGTSEAVHYQSVRAAVVFTGGLPKEDGTGSSGDISYKIRLVDQTALENTKALWPLFQFPGPNTANAVNYINAGFIGLQIAVDKALIELVNPGIEHGSLPHVSLQTFPYPPYKHTIDFNLLYFILVPQLMVLGFIFLVPSLIRNIVSEKETGIKELMKLMGLPNWTHWFGWMASSMVMLGISVTIIVALYFIPFDSGTGAVIIFSNPILWWVVLMLYAMSATAFCFFVSTFFNKPTLGTTVGIILWLLSYYVPVQLLEAKYNSLSFCDKLFSALLPNVALHWAIKAMCSFEGRSIGARWSNLFEPVNSIDSLSVGSMCIMFIVDTILLIGLTIYLENILPSAFGLRKPWWYPIKHFVGFFYSNGGNGSKINMTTDNFDNDKDSAPPGFEPDPSNLEASIILNELSKRWGTKVAVDNLSLKIYGGQITALLGHNGAGKTTTMSMLTGLFAPTSGTAWIRGFNIRTDMDSVRRSLGLCPQNNMLFNHLTVEEHLEFFARLKGLGPESTKVEVKGLLEQLQLADKKRTLAWALSGGQKRKLSLGIALVGRPDVIILDEPTSGMDPEARRAVWDLLLRYRGGHDQGGPGPLILLSTHFMEEADVLGDRIAIMSAGRVKCCGSPLFLKKWYGTGYTLKMTLDSERPELTSTKILQLIQIHVPQAIIKENRGGQEVFISLPAPAGTEDPNEGMDADRPDGNFSSKSSFGQAPDTSAFPSLFQTLEEAKGTLGIRTIGLSLTTMDEVFVKVGESDSVDGIGKPSYGTSNPTKLLKPSDQSHSQKFNSGLQLRISQFRGLFTKRFLYTLRSRKLAIAQFLLPIATLIVTIWLSNQNFEPSPSAPPLEMKLGDYKDAVTLWSVSGVGDEALSKAFTSALQSSGSKNSIRVGANVQAALIDVGAQDLATYREKYILAGQLNSTHFQALYSSIPNHAAPLATNIMTNTMLKFHSGPTQNAKITTTSHPLEGAYSSLLAPAEANPIFSTVVPILFGVLVPLGLALYSASTIVFPVEEKLNKAKQLQLMTGTSPMIYWLSSWAWDGLVLGLLVCIMTLCLPIFQSYGAFTVYHGGGVFFLILITYGFSSISFSYLCSLFVSTVPGGFSLVTIIHLVTGMIMSLVVFLLEDNNLADETSSIRFFGRFFPTFGASLSLMRFTSIATKNSRCNILSEATKTLICNPSFDIKAELRSCCSNCKDFKPSELSDFLEPSPDPTLHCFRPQPYLVWETQISSSVFQTSYSVPGIGQDLAYLFLIGILYKVLLLLWEYGLLQRIFGALILKSGNRNTQFPKESEDEDVKLETRRVDDLVDSGRVNEDALVVQHFCKNYGSLAAVSNLSFGVHYGEVFGLLGVNGAGKTTSFRMLTGDEVGNFGNAWASMYNLLNQRSKFLSQIGYCPQFDGIVGVLTGTEMLELFARLRGIRGDILGAEVEKWIRQLGLYDARNVQCMKYSGGMKRRLSAAMALIGDSPIILLDEPTSGVDPIARRQFWEVISSVRSAGQAVVLTSHSMEECEALCSRLGIMVNGQFQCLGGVQHLKSKFALGFSLVLKLKSPSSQNSESQEFQNLLIQELESEISTKFAPANLKDKHQNLLQFQVLNTSLGWGQLFTWMEEIKSHSKYSEILEDYTVSETTLEEVFLSFARKQYPEGAREANLSWWRKLCS